MHDDGSIALPHASSDLAARLDQGLAVAWSEPVTIRTYAAGAPDRYPLFLSRRVYQGSSGRVYPIPFIDRVDREASPRRWEAIHLENRWIRLMVLPELGGRIHIGYDKSAGYDFFYRNNVIKPALVGLAGPWISGGVEFNWPQHHRPATYLPVCTEIEEHDDGSVTVWCSDHDPFARMRGTHGIRLHPDRAVVELVVRLHNRTSEVQTFLWWANAAARVHDDYQSFFPTDVDHVADHARRAITAFPEADRRYYGVDYSALHASGGDRIDFYKNIPVPTSYMVTGTRDAFFGGYDHAAGAGFVHVADRHIAPGKKQWTWGDSPFGHAWDRHLTDDDGPYVELMAGVYTDNQPDFAWLEPGETKTFRQVWFPYQDIGVVHQATEEVAVHLEVGDHRLIAGAAVTRERTAARVRITVRGQDLYDECIDLAPGTPWTWSTLLTEDVVTAEARIAVEHDGVVLLEWSPRRPGTADEPTVAVAPPHAEEIDSIEELYLTGVHLLQYRHPTRSPLPYWDEALRRDPEDARCNLALAADRYRRGLYPAAEAHARRALRRLTLHNANPREGEASYLLGLVLTRLGRAEAAVDALAKAAWDRRWLAPASVELARHAAAAGNASQAIERAEAAGPGDGRASAIRVVQLRSLGRDQEAARILEVALSAEPLDQTCRFLRDGVGALGGLDSRTMIDVALDLKRAGEVEAGLEVLAVAAGLEPSAAGNAAPMAHYHRACILAALGRDDEAAEARARARTVPDELCFPAGQDDHDALAAAIAVNPDDSRAKTLLAMLLFDVDRAEEALQLWRSAIDAGATDPVTLRNAALATYAVDGDIPAALDLYDRAVQSRPDARLVYERDQLLARADASRGDRLALLEQYRDLVLQRDDAAVEYCGLLIADGRLDDAEVILRHRDFAPWEGGEGRVLATWEDLHLALADRYESAGNRVAALSAARESVKTPPNLGEVRHELADTGRVYGRVAELLVRLGREDEADEIRRGIRTRTSIDPVLADGTIDYFATSLPDPLLFPPTS